MAIIQTWCRVRRTNVTCVTDLEDNVDRLICPYYDEATRYCGLRAAALTDGPLGQLLERVSEDTLASHGKHCDLA